MCFGQLIFETICKASKFKLIENVLDLLENVLESHGKVTDFTSSK